MISHRFRCIFFHQRKNAGSSLIASFGLLPEDPDWHVFNDGTLSPGWDKREEAIRDYVVVTVIRNPWDRFVSGWNYLNATRNRPLLDVLREFPGKHTSHDHRHLCRLQSDTLVDKTGSFVPDQILRFEHLEKDYGMFCERIGKPRQALPHLNSTNHPPYADLYNEEARELLYCHFKKDIDLFGYDFAGEQKLSPEMETRIPGYHA